eukprot:gene39769-49148_t
MTAVIAVPSFAAIAVFSLFAALIKRPSVAPLTDRSAQTIAAPEKHMAQVVGVQWLNPLQRLDYPTEWQLLWTLGLARPNKDDDMVRSHPKLFSTLQVVGPIAVGNGGTETFKGYHHKYLREVFVRFRKTWRELAGIRVEYALPKGRLDPVEATEYTQRYIAGTFDIGNVHFPGAWSRSTLPDVRVTMGGANAGFTSLTAALDYLQTHPNETVWVMNWDAPSRPFNCSSNGRLGASHPNAP